MNTTVVPDTPDILTFTSLSFSLQLHKISVNLVLSIMILTGCLGNALVIIAVAANQVCRSKVSGILIQHLSACYLLRSTVYYPIVLYMQSTGRTSFLQNHHPQLCLWSGMVARVCSVQTIIILLLMALERLVVVSNNLSIYYGICQRRYAVVVPMVTLALNSMGIMVVPYFMNSVTTSITPLGACSSVYIDEVPRMMVPIFTTILMICAVAMCIVAVCKVYKAKGRSVRLQRMGSSVKGVGSVVRRTYISAVRHFIAMFVFSFLTYLPYIILFVLSLKGQKNFALSGNVLNVRAQWFELVGRFAPVANPILHAYFVKPIRLTVWHMVTCKVGLK